MTNVFYWKNSVSLYPASVCTPRPNLPVTPSISLDFLLLHFFPYDENAPFLVLVLKGLVSLLRMSQFQLLNQLLSQWLWHRLGSRWYWLVCLGKKLRSFCHFGDCIQILHFRASQVALVVKNPPAIAGAAVDCGSIPGSGRYPGEGNGYPHQYSYLKNTMGQGAWQGQSMGFQRIRQDWAHTHIEFHILLLTMRATPFLLRHSCPQ